MIETRPGDLVLTHGSGPIHHAIRVAQGIRFRGARRRYAYFNHAAVIVGHRGEIVEAMMRGDVRYGDLEAEYHGVREYVIVDTKASASDRDQMVRFAVSCVGQEYGLLTIAALLVWTLVGGKLVIGMDGSEICSALAAQSIVRDGTIFTRAPLMMMPADLAEHYDVQVPV